MVKCIYLFIYLFIESDIHRIIVYKRTFVPKKFSAKTMDEHLHVHTIVENTHGLNAKEVNMLLQKLEKKANFLKIFYDSMLPGNLTLFIFCDCCSYALLCAALASHVTSRQMCLKFLNDVLIFWRIDLVFPIG